MRRIFAAAGVAITLASPAVAQQERADMLLRAAGFNVRLAVTDEQLANLKRVPPRTILSRTRDGRVFYLYADPDFCKCVLFGDAGAFKAYRDMASNPVQQPDQAGARGSSAMGEVIREMNGDEIGPTDMFNVPF
jgi:hypothetical protein